MNMLEAFFSQNNNLYSMVEDVVLEQLVKDESNYNVVDGEEGDYGTIDYCTKEGVKICTYFNEGGDTDWYEFTDDGVKLMKEYMSKVFGQWLEESVG